MCRILTSCVQAIFLGNGDLVPKFEVQMSQMGSTHVLYADLRATACTSHEQIA